MSIGTFFTVAGGLGNLWAQRKAGKVAEAGQKEYLGSMEANLAGQKSDIYDLMGADAHRDFLQTDQAQSMLRMTQDQLKEQANRIRGGLARSGGTTEAEIAATGQTNQSYADVMNRLAGHGSQYNQMARSRLMQALQGFAGQQQNLIRDKQGFSADKAKGLSDAGQGLSDSMTQMGIAQDKEMWKVLKLFGIDLDD